MNIGDRIKFARNKKQMSLDDLGAKIGVSKSTIMRYETGDIEKIPSNRIELIASALDVSPAYLMGWNDNTFALSAVDRVTGFIKVFDGIPCGEPRLIDEDVVDYQPTFLPNPSEYFAVIVHGDSMIGVGIEDGDKVTFHAQNTAENGNIVACRINEEECTLKRFRQKGDIVVLMPENPSYEPIIVPVSDFETQVAQILGVAKEVSKKL